nr:LuxR family transcriptional regulator [Patulibacter sp. SYSU D01012]
MRGSRPTPGHTGGVWARASAIVGRLPERAAGGELLDALAAGRGGCLVLEGPAGVGKTRLLDALCADAEARGLRVTRATAHERDGALSLAGRIAPALGWPLASAGAGTPALLAGPPADLADRPPTVVAVDDAHWADDASLRTLAPLAEATGRHAIALVLTARPHAADDPAGDALADLLQAARPVRRLTVGGLDEADVAQVVRAALPGPVPDELARRCHHATAGNPLLLGLLLAELARGGRPDPDTIAVPDVARFVGRELRRLTAGARAVALALAVLGPCPAPGVLRAVAGPAAAPLDAAVAALAASGLVAVDPGPRFVHPLVERAVLDAVPAAARAAAHGAAAEALARRGAPADVVAAHRLRTVPAGRADVVTALRAGAARALAAGEASAAEALLLRALDEPPTADDRPGILHELAVAGVQAGGEGGLDRFAVAADAQPDAASRARVGLDHASALIELGRPVEALGLLDAVLAAGDALPTAVGRRVHARRALVAVDLRLAERVVPSVLQAAQGVRVSDDASRELLAVRAYFEVLGGRPDVAVATAASAFAPAEATTEMPGLLMGLGVLTLAAGERFAAADRVVEHHAAIARLRGDRSRRATAAAARGLLELRRGALLPAEAALRVAVEQTPRANRLGRALAAAFLVRALTLRGRHEDAAAVLHDHRDLADGSSAGHGLALAAAGLALATGDAAGGIAQMEAVRRAGLRASPVVSSDRELALAYAAAGRHAEAHEAAARLRAEADLLPAARGGRGDALAVAAVVGDAAAREERLRAALELLRESALHLELATAAGRLGGHLRRQGRRVDARVLLGEALTLAEACGAAPLCADLEAELAATGVARTPGAPGAPTLTPSERRIAALAARGRSNVEIAGELFLSRKTVEMHLTAVYRKLGIGSRHELAAALGDADPALSAPGS